MRLVHCLLAAAVLFSAHATGQTPNPDRRTGDETTFANNEFFPKGGIGIITTDLSIDLKSNRNELVLGNGRRWAGAISSQPEAALFFDNRVWSSRSLPDQFDLARSVVVSFEQDKVRFFDFRTMSGGFYRREREAPPPEVSALAMRYLRSILRTATFPRLDGKSTDYVFIGDARPSERGWRAVVVRNAGGTRRLVWDSLSVRDPYFSVRAPDWMTIEPWRSRLRRRHARLHAASVLRRPARVSRVREPHGQDVRDPHHDTR